jgi:hypothetical protein
MGRLPRSVLALLNIFEGAVMRAFVVAVLLVACLGVAGCAQPPDVTGVGTAIESSADAAKAATCKTNRAQLDQQYTMAQDSGAPADMSAIVAQLGVKCPAGGAYSWDAATSKTKCSVHGE